MSAERDFDVTCFGQICVDHIFQTAACRQPRLGRETYAQSYTTALGGGAGIVAITLARLGLRTALVSRIGADAAGSGLLSQLRAEEVDVAHVEVLRDTPTDVSVAFTCAQDRGFLSHMAAGRALDAVCMESGCLARSRHLHLCVGPTDDPEHWRTLLRQAHAVGTTVSIDLGWQEVWDRGWCTWMGEAEIVFPNEAEALRLAHTRALDRAMALLGARGAVVVVKRGGAGVSTYHMGTRLDLPPAPVRAVVDPTGAGDMFAAGFLWAYLRGRSLCAALAAGTLCGARCVEQPGGLVRPPAPDELQQAVAA